MKKPLLREKIGDGIYFSQIIDDKFKHNRMTLHALLPLDPTTVSDSAMLPLLVQKGSKNLPENTHIEELLSDLYGASLSGTVSRYNRYQRVSFSIRALDNRYALEKEDLVTQSVDLLLDAIFNPHFQKEFDVEKQFLKDGIQAEINDKRTYAIRRTMEEMFRGDKALGTPASGTLETADKVTPQRVEAAWKEMMTTAPMEIIFVGSGNPEPAKEAFRAAFANIQQRHAAGYTIIAPDSSQRTPRQITEPMEGIQQGKLVLGFRMAGVHSQPTKDAARLFGALYGGTPFSKLFLNVREKLSLAYYCAARVDTVNNYMLVDSGIESDKKEQTEKEVLLQLEAMQQGDFTQEELDNTRMLVANALRGTEDALVSTESWYLGQILRGQSLTPEEDIANLANVTKEDIVQVAQGVTLDTVYFLTGKEEDSHEENNH